jgi:hypothetical protein
MNINIKLRSFTGCFVWAYLGLYYTAVFLNVSSRMNFSKRLTNYADPAPKLSQFADLLITCHSNIEISKIYKQEHNS